MRILRIAAIALLLPWACTETEVDGDPAGPAGSGATITSTIGAEGGEVTLEGATLSIPAGALAAPTDITITSTTGNPPASFTAWSSPVYRFEPAGLAFLAPVAVRLAFTGSPSSPTIWWTAEGGGDFEALETTVDGSVAAASIVHFSEGFVAPAEAGGGGGSGGGGPIGEVSIAYHKVFDPAGVPARIAPFADGDVAVTGTFSGQLDLGGGPLPGQGAFLARLGPGGELRWARTGLPVNTQVLAPHADGDLVIAGHHDVARLKPDGEDRWRRSFGKVEGRQGEAWSYGAAVDAAGNTTFVGVINGGADFGGGPLVSTEGQPAFLATFDKAGNHVFSDVYFGPHSTSNTGVVAMPGGGLVFVGTHFGEIDFGGGTLPQPGLAGHDPRLHVVKLAASGAHAWSRGFGAPGRKLDPAGVTLDGTGDVVVLATFDNGSSIEVEGAPLTTEVAPGVAEITLSAADGSVTGVRAWTWLGVSRDTPAPRDGRLFMTGTLSRPVDFGSGQVGPTPDPQQPVPVSYLAVLDAGGPQRLALTWQARLEMEPRFRFVHVEGLGLAPDGKGGLWWLARFDGPVELEPGLTLPDVQQRQALLVRFAP